VYTLTAEFLYSQLVRLIEILRECGGIVLNLMSDNHAVNRAVYQTFRTQEDWVGKYPKGERNEPFFLLYDTVHLLKNFRNNWITERNKEIAIQLSADEEETIGYWKDIVDTYERDRNIIQRTQVSYSACYPSTFDRQKVNLVTQVFSEKTAAALKMDGHNSTAKVVSHLSKLWKILNVKVRFGHLRLNDYGRCPIQHSNDENLLYLEQMAKTITRMKSSQGKGRKRVLTSETRAAFVQTLNGLVHLCRYLLNNVGVE
jgi:hypothetical protein